MSSPSSRYLPSSGGDSPGGGATLQLLQGRYKVSYDHVLGEGGYARVYKGLDRHTNTQVAVKIYKAGLGDADWDVSHQHFLDTIETMDGLTEGLSDAEKVRGAVAVADCPVKLPKAALGRSPDSSPKLLTRRSNSGRAWSRTSFGTGVSDLCKAPPPEEGSEGAQLAAWSTAEDMRRRMVQVVGYSEQANMPGVDIDSEQLFIVFELGKENLETRLGSVAAAGKTLGVEELRQIQWSLISVVCCLHSAGYVHLDIKPSNVVRFGRTWKLIDFDGAVRTGTVISNTKLCTTPCYMSPEAARAWLHEGGETQVSRLMDVWSIGMCAIEAVFMQPIMGVWYHDWHAETGCDRKFLEWLADADKVVLDDDMCDALREIDPEMCNLFQVMLEKDPKRRADITQCLAHPWFEPIFSQMRKGALQSDTPASTASTRTLAFSPRSGPGSDISEDASGSSDSSAGGSGSSAGGSGSGNESSSFQASGSPSLATAERAAEVRAARACTVM